jgi:DNA-binding MarR family transcriptional regulator/GNAT superfamily N-acetyltransferase
MIAKRQSSESSDPLLAQRCDALRAFNRFYTHRIGVLKEHLLDTRFSLAESRLLWELAHSPGATASELAVQLDLDMGYLSRLLGSLKAQGLVTALRAEGDARRRPLSLSAAGQRAFAPLDKRSRQQMAQLLGTLGETDQLQLLDAAARIEQLLGPSRKAGAFMLRPHRAGDIGWIASRHGALYAQEYGWDLRFEALVAHIGARFIDEFEPAREACWIAERDGQPLGCVRLVQCRDEQTRAVEAGTAQLRLLLIDPAARGLGLGQALVNECERFARAAGYQRIRLWTNSVLTAARGIYQRCGYKLLATRAHQSFGVQLEGETWELALDRPV